MGSNVIGVTEIGYAKFLSINRNSVCHFTGLIRVNTGSKSDKLLSKSLILLDLRNPVGVTTYLITY